MTEICIMIRFTFKWRNRMKKTIEIDFIDFWPGFNKENNFFTILLRKNYNVCISDHPNYIFVSLFGTDYLNYNAIKICFIGENSRPNFTLYDYILGFDWVSLGDRYYRLPLYRLDNHYPMLFNRLEIKQIPTTKNKFCNYIYSNANADQHREEFFSLLNEYKKVDSGGRHLNNLGYYVGDKLAFQSDYKFTIAFENTSHPGYTTEKITDAYIANTVPIYWGNPEVVKEFNSDSFINCHDFEKFDQVIEYIKKVDSDDDLYLKMLNAPIFSPKILESLEEDAILSFLDNIFSNDVEKARRITNNT